MTKTIPPVFGQADNNLEQQALQQFQAGHYKEAIALYRQLLADSENYEWQQRLAECYLLRAETCADRELFDQALSLWEQYRQQAQPPYKHFDRYVLWLHQAGHSKRVRNILEQSTTQQLDREYPELAALLGFLILTKHPEWQRFLPQDSMFIAHLSIVQSALQSSLREAEVELKQLPYRSAFRDLRTLLKACITMVHSHEEARSLLTKIPAHSPYAETAGLVLISTYRGSELADKLANLSRTQRQLVGEIVGLNPRQLELTEALSQIRGELPKTAQFDLAIRFESLCGREFAQRFCSTILPDCSERLADFQQNFSAIDAFNENRLKALAMEYESRSEDAEYYWRQAIKSLTDENGDRALKIALILRHLAENHNQPTERIPLLVESLKYAPDDKDCYMQILNVYNQRDESEEVYRKWLETTLAKFPNDTDVLTQAAQKAAHNKDFSAAIRYGKRLLSVDPLNSAAKQLIFSCHLSHARQSILEKHYDSAEQAIGQADTLKLGKHNTQQTELFRGFLCWLSGDKNQGLTRIIAALKQLNTDPVSTRFQAVMETLSFCLSPSIILAELAPSGDHLLSSVELSRLMQLIDRYRSEGSDCETMIAALNEIKVSLEQSLQHRSYDENQLLELCRILDSVKHFELLRHCAKGAQTKWPKPIWNYFRIYADSDGEPARCSFMQYLRLEKNLYSAKQIGDERARVLIEQYLARYHEAHPSKSLGAIENLFTPAPVDSDRAKPLETLLDRVPADLLQQLEMQLEPLAQSLSPEQLIQNLELTDEQSDKLLKTIMQQPDLFTALLLLKAAKKSAITLQITLEEVFECFRISL